ncbi:unnamed protein product [Dracunculus medinensis]|uniref:Secreted protein n=1 Tax=Dracunculus medinensis TaxID=318479 RepID=A0A0N4URC8_DRAME|nr:unnamed protein product [Dracunculus medinensis]
MWTTPVASALFFIFFPSSVNAGHSDIADCVMMIGNNNNVKKPSISPSACRDIDEAFCSAVFPLDANNLMPLEF